MEQSISINTMEEYIGKLTSCLGFSVVEDHSTITLNVPPKLGTGYMKIQDISDDIAIGIIDVQLNMPLVSYYESYSNTCEATYCIAGHVSYTETGVPRTCLAKNEVGVYAIPRTRGMMMIPSGERVLLVSVVSRQPFYEQLPYVGQCELFQSEAVQDILCRMVLPKRVTARLHSQFSRIMENEMSESLKNTYADSMGKVMLSEIWQERVVSPLCGKNWACVGGYEQKVLMDAKEILTQQYLEPPTIGQLAKKVGLNEHSLKTGFKQVFGKSPFEYVRSIRMETAKVLIEDNTLNIGQIAAMVGYVNASHFARAFRTEYGVNPKAFRFRA